MPYGGVVGYFQYVMAFLQEIFKYIFDLSAGMTWNQNVDNASGAVPYYPSHGQWTLTGNLPNLTEKGQDIVAAIMTIVHNGIVALAQFTTFLPANQLGGY